MTDISLRRGPIREPEEWGTFIGDFERQVREGSGNGSSLSVSVSKFCEGNLGEGSCTEVSGSYVKEGFGDRASISMPWLRKESLEGVSLLGNPRDLSRKAVDMNHGFLVQAP